jgi:hypothetical protein
MRSSCGFERRCLPERLARHRQSPESRPMGVVMFIGYAIETLRDEARRNAASTPPVEAVLAAGYCHKPHPFALTGEQVKDPRLIAG